MLSEVMLSFAMFSKFFLFEAPPTCEKFSFFFLDLFSSKTCDCLKNLGNILLGMLSKVELN